MADDSSKGRGCIFYGCLMVIVVVVAVLVGTYFGTRHVVRNMVTTWTDTAPAPVPSLDLSDREINDRSEKIQTEFSQAVAREETFSLDEKDLNVLLASNPSFEPYTKQIYLQVSSNDLKAKVSLPLDQFDLWKKVSSRFGGKALDGRYLNATVTLEPSINTNQELRLVVKSAQVKGSPLPDSFTGKLELDEIIHQANTNKAARAVLEKVQSIVITNGEVRLQLQK